MPMEIRVLVGDVVDLEAVRKKKRKILRLAARRGASNVRIFGSVARGEARPDSDVDFLVSLEPGRSIMDLANLRAELEELVGREVDLLTDKGIHHLIRDRILSEAVAL